MTQVETKELTENQIEGKRLGRHVQHDPRSWQFPAPMASELQSVKHERMVPVFDQGQIGDCTANAALGMLMTEPFATKQTRRFTEADVVPLYHDETQHDGIPGVYPPDDTGSSGLAAMKALRRAGWISAYSHMFSVTHVLKTLVLQPVCIGIDWFDTFDTPDADGLMRFTYKSNVRGGHEIVVDESDVDNKLVWITNSWGEGWGIKGRAAFSFQTLEELLGKNGDAVTAKQ